MSYRPRGSSWMVDVTVNGKRRTATCSTEEEAKQEEARLRHALLSGEEPGPKVGKSWTVSKASDKAWTTAWRDSKSADAMDQLRVRVTAYWGAETPLHTITVDALDEWVETMKGKGKANGTINRHLACLSKMMTVAVKRGGLLSKPSIPRQRESQGRVRFLTPEEEAKITSLLSHWGKDDHADATVVLVDTGLRLGELWRIKDQDVNFAAGQGKGTITIWENKADLPRTVPMTSRVRSIMRRRQGSARPFPYHNCWYRWGWTMVRTHMGMTSDPQFVPHVLRHTCASRLVQRGVPIPAVQKWLGHKTITVTMRYAHLSPDDLFTAAVVLEQPIVAEVVAK